MQFRLTDFRTIALGKMLSKRGLEKQGEVQRFIDSEVLRLTYPYVPFDKSDLVKSGTLNTKIGSGIVVYRTPYARLRYQQARSIGLRGPKWFHRSKIDNKKQILNKALQKAGAR